jgi:hypothetical protein
MEDAEESEGYTVRDKIMAGVLGGFFLGLVIVMADIVLDGKLAEWFGGQAPDAD